MSGSTKSAQKSWVAKVLNFDGDTTPDKYRSRVNVQINLLNDEIARLGKKGLAIPDLVPAWKKFSEDANIYDSLHDPGKRKAALNRLEATLAQTVAKAQVDAALCVAKWEVASVQRDRTEYLIMRAKQVAAGQGADAGQLAWLVTPALAMGAAIAALDGSRKVDSPEALKAWERAWGGFAETADRYQNEVAGKPLIDNADRIKKDNPTGPEAQLEALFERAEYTKKLSRMAMTAERLGIKLPLDPGESLAVFEYTTGTYKDINAVLLGKEIPDTDGSQKKRAEKISELTVKALKKLPAYKGTPFTQRGETDWPGAAKQYKTGNVFEIKIYWSTGAAYQFPGIYNIRVHGKTGKDVSKMSDHPNEAEVLFPPGTKFKVRENVTIWTDEKRGIVKQYDVIVDEQ